MSELRVNNITSRDGQTGTIVAGIASVTSTSHFVPPSGTTAERGSRGRGVWGGGYTPTQVNTMDYVTIASTGDAQDFGDLSQARSSNGACSSSTRGVFGGGIRLVSPMTNSNVIDYITISTLGDAQDFGDLIQGRFDLAGFASPTRGIFAGGKFTPAPTINQLNSIEYITIASTGNDTDFGDLTAKKSAMAAGAPSTPSVTG